MAKGRTPVARRAACLGLCAALALGGCAGTSGPGPSEKQAQWLETAGLGATETPEDLYEKALLEGGSLTVYTCTTRAMDTKDSFEKQYPGLVVEMRDARTDHLVDALLAEYERGEMLCDVLLCSGANVRIPEELAARGIVTKYIPADMADKLRYTEETGHLPFMSEAHIFCYNGAVWDEAPFTNLWQLCEAEFYGRVYTPDPLLSSGTYALFESIVLEDAAMRAAYEQLYGEPLQTAEGESAGAVFIRRLAGNGLVVTNSSDEAALAVGAPGQTEPAVGTMISSKLRMNAVGYTLVPQYDLAPFAGVASHNSVTLITGTPRVNTAKLFVRWLLGEADGTGAGYKPFLQAGSWSVRSDVSSGGNPPFAQLNQLVPDNARLNAAMTDFETLWVDALEQARPNGTEAP